MKHYTTILIVAALALASRQANAALILVDHDDGNAGNGVHDSDIRNGGFEGPNTGVDGEAFSNTDFWVNIGTAGQGDQARRTNINDTGDYSSVNNGGGSRIFALDAGRTLQYGDVLSLEFRALRAFQSNSSTAITADLYYTADDTITGTPTVIDTILTGGMPTSFATFSSPFSPVSGAAVGKNLFLRFEQSAGPGFTRTDSWSLSVEPIPEPTTLLIWSLLAGLGVGLGWRRRK